MTKNAPRNVALFGGSFNPPHICHTLATLWVLQTQPIDEVWWIPTFEHAFSKDLVDFSDRMEMCKEATSDLQNVRINSIEKELGGESRTIDTVQALREEHPDREFWLMVGADILEETTRWKDWDGLMELVHLIVVGRRGYDRLEATAGVDLELPDISSTIIRDALSQCDYESIQAWIPRRVLDYISRHHLYLGKDCQ